MSAVTPYVSLRRFFWIIVRGGIVKVLMPPRKFPPASRRADRRTHGVDEGLTNTRFVRTDASSRTAGNHPNSPVASARVAPDETSTASVYCPNVPTPPDVVVAVRAPTRSRPVDCTRTAP